MYFNISGQRVNGNVISESTTPSKHTGLLLAKIEVELIMDRQMHDILVSFLTSGTITSVDEEGRPLKSWKIGSNSYSYRDGEKIVRHSIKLEEIEVLTIKELNLDGFIFNPYSYSEDFDDDSLTINAKVKISVEQEIQFNEFRENKQWNYFPVIRSGINETPLEMRFGTIYWSKHGDETKFDMTLVEKSYDTVKRRLPYHVELSNIINMVSLDIETLNGLIGILNRKMILDQNEIEEIRKFATDKKWKKMQEIFLVKDIDEN